MNRKIIITAAASGILFFTLGACIFSKNKEAASAIQLIQLLAQATNCWISAGSTATTTCSIGIGGATPDANTKLAVNGRISSSVLGVYCGKTSGTFTGAIGGYTAAKDKCVAACSNNTNAHLCTVHEISMSAQIGLPLPTSGGHYRISSGDAGVANDCQGWTDGTAGWSSHTWFGGATSVLSTVACNNTIPMLCCL